MSTHRTAELAADPRVRRGMEAQLAERERRLAAGERSLGWKLAFGSSEAMARLQIAAPLIGFLTDRSPLEPGLPAAVGDWAAPVLEPEIVARLGADLAPGGGRGEAAAAIAGVAPAFELVDVDPPPADVIAILAGNVFHRRIVLVPDAGIAPDRLGAVRAVITVNGAERAVDDPQAATGDVVGLIRHVADLLGAFGGALRAGERVICGAIVPPIAISPDDVVSYRLDPAGELSLRIR